jgi:hypothetical protein
MFLTELVANQTEDIVFCQKKIEHPMATIQTTLAYQNFGHAKLLA